MGLKQNIVVVCDFTNNQHKGHGNTPSDFVEDYIARDDATEAITPTTDTESEGLDYFLDDYVARVSATEQAIDKNHSPEQLKENLAQLTGKDGRTFDQDHLSCTDKQLYQNGDKLQRLYDEGHSVQKVVISFTTDYLKERGIVDRDYEHHGPGSFKGQVDQMKLRKALHTGLEYMCDKGDYVNPVWAGSIQVDTNHVHAHVVIADDVDLDKSHRMKQLANGKVEEAGKLLNADKQNFRMTCDRSLIDQYQLHQYHDQVTNTRQLSTGLVKALSYEDLSTNTQLQNIMGALPPQKVMWKANSKAPQMQRANELMDNYVNTLTTKYPKTTGYQTAMQKVRQYAQLRSSDNDDYDQYVKNGAAKLKTQIKNGIYNSFKNAEPTKDQPKTAYQRYNEYNQSQLRAVIAKANAENNQNGDVQIAAMAYRQQSYPKRLQTHLTLGQVFENQTKTFEDASTNGKVDRDATVMHGFYQNETKYNYELVDKYRHLLHIPETTPSQNTQLQNTYVQLRNQGQKEGIWDAPKTVDKNQQQVRHDLADTFLNDKNMTPFQQNTKLTTELRAVKDTPTVKLDAESVAILDTIGTAYPQYQNLGQQLKGDAVTKNVPVSDEFQRLSQQYCSQLDKSTHSDYQHNGVSWSQVVNGDEAYDDLMQHLDEVPAPPTKKVDDFDNVKANDLDDMGFDYTPKMSHQVNDTSAKQYDDAVAMREVTSQGALNYVQNTQQDDTQLLELQLQLKKQRELADKVRREKQLQLQTTLEDDEDTNYTTTDYTIDYQTTTQMNHTNQHVAKNSAKNFAIELE